MEKNLHYRGQEIGYYQSNKSSLMEKLFSIRLTKVIAVAVVCVCLWFIASVFVITFET